MLLAFSFSAKGQPPNVFRTAEDSIWSRSAITGEFAIDYQSNFWGWGSVFDFYQSPNITNELVDQWSDNSPDRAMFFIDNPINISFKKAVNQRMAWSVGWVKQSTAISDLSKEVMSLAADGNTGYKGETLALGANQFDYFNTSGVAMGWHQRFIKESSQITLNVGLNLLSTSGLTQIQSSKFDVFTEENAEYIMLDYAYSYAYQRAGKAFSGVGVTGSIGVDLKFTSFGMSLNAERIGTSWWSNENFRTASAEGSLTYEGDFLELADLGTLGDTSQVNMKRDSILDIIRPDVKTKSTYPFPAMFNYRLYCYLKDKGLLSIQIAAVPTRISRPGVSLEYKHQLGQNIWASGRFSNGFFGSSTLGAGIGYSHDQIILSAVTDGLLSLNSDANTNVLARFNAAFLF